MVDQVAATAESNPPNANGMIDDLKKQRGLLAAGFIGSSEILERVREYERQDASVPQTISIAAAKGDDIEKLALLDGLTELYNHRTLLKELKAELNRARRYKHQVSLAALSIDNLEYVQQTYGVLTVDAVYKVLSNVLRASIREVDIPARYNDALFLVILPQTSAAGASLVSERIRQRIGNQAITHNWQNFSATASVGVANFPAHASEYDELIARAIEALEYAKHRGGDRVLCI